MPQLQYVSPAGESRVYRIIRSPRKNEAWEAPLTTCSSQFARLSELSRRTAKTDMRIIPMSPARKKMPEG